MITTRVICRVISVDASGGHTSTHCWDAVNAFDAYSMLPVIKITTTPSRLSNGDITSLRHGARRFAQFIKDIHL